MRNTGRGNILFMSPCILQIMAPFVTRLSKGGCGAAGGTKSSKKTKKTEKRFCRRLPVSIRLIDSENTASKEQRGQPLESNMNVQPRFNDQELLHRDVSVAHGRHRRLISR